MIVLMKAARKHALIAVTATGFAMLLPGDHALADNRTDAALAALRAVIADPYKPVAPILSEFSFSEAQYLVDGLTGNEQRALARAIREHLVPLPSGIDTAIRAKAARPASNRG